MDCKECGKPLSEKATTSYCKHCRHKVPRFRCKTCNELAPKLRDGECQSCHSSRDDPTPEEIYGPGGLCEQIRTGTGIAADSPAWDDYMLAKRAQGVANNNRPEKRRDAPLDSVEVTTCRDPRRSFSGSGMADC